MTFKNIAGICLLFPTAGYVMADSQLQLSLDVMVEQRLKNIDVKPVILKTKLTMLNIYESPI